MKLLNQFFCVPEKDVKSFHLYTEKLNLKFCCSVWVSKRPPESITTEFPFTTFKTQKVKTVTFSVVLREFEDDTEEEILKEYKRIRKLVGRQWNQELRKLKYESAVQWKGMRLEIETSKGRYKRILVELWGRV